MENILHECYCYLKLIDADERRESINTMLTDFLNEMTLEDVLDIDLTVHFGHKCKTESSKIFFLKLFLKNELKVSLMNYQQFLRKQYFFSSANMTLTTSSLKCNKMILLGKIDKQ